MWEPTNTIRWFYGANLIAIAIPNGFTWRASIRWGEGKVLDKSFPSEKAARHAINTVFALWHVEPDAVYTVRGPGTFVADAPGEPDVGE